MTAIRSGSGSEEGLLRGSRPNRGGGNIFSVGWDTTSRELKSIGGVLKGGQASGHRKPIRRALTVEKDALFFTREGIIQDAWAIPMVA